MLIPLVALLAACGAAADAPELSPEASTDASPAAAPAPSDTIVAEQLAAVQPAPVGEAPAAAPPPAPVAAPAPQAAPAPVAAPPELAPTPEHPLIIECVDDECLACTTDLRAEHLDWYDSGAARCQKRTCGATVECADLGDDLVCAQQGGPSGPSGRAVCRSPRIALGHACPVNEVSSTDGHAPVCEPGLWCAPLGSITHLVCQVYDR